MNRPLIAYLLGLALYLTAWPAILPAGQVLTFSAAKGFLDTVPIQRLLSRAYAELGIGIEVKLFSAQRSIMEAGQGATDGELFRIGGLSRDFPDLIMVDVPCQYFDAYIYLPEDRAFVLDGWKSIPPGYTLAAPFGIKYLEQRIDTHRLKAFFTPFPTDALDLMLAGKADYSVATRALSQTIAKRNLGQMIIRLEPVLERVPSFHYLHRKHADLVPRIRDVLARMSREGSL